VMGPDGAANIIFKNDIDTAEDKAKARADKIAEYRGRFATPYIAAARGFVDDVIEPAASRPMIVSAFEMLAGKREALPPKKHGNVPL